MKKRFYFFTLIFFLIVIIGVESHFYIKNNNREKTIGPSSSGPFPEKASGEIELISRVNDRNILVKKEPMSEVMKEWKIWEEGVYIRDDYNGAHVLTIKKIPPRRIKIVIDYGTYKRDNVVSQGKLISSAREEMNNDELIIFLGLSKLFFDNLEEEEKEKYLTEAFLSTLYRISHTEQNFEIKEEKLREVLVYYNKENKTLFEIK